MNTKTMLKYFRAGTAVFFFLQLFISLPPVVLSQNSVGGAAAKAQNGPISMVTISGTVKETMDSGGYTYALVDDGSAKTWVALPQTRLAVGNEITCQPGMVMNNFKSSSLNHTFEQIVFSSGVTSYTAGSAPPQESQIIEAPADLPKVKDADNWDDFFNKK